MTRPQASTLSVGQPPAMDKLKTAIIMFAGVMAMLFSGMVIEWELAALVLADFPLNRENGVLYGRDFLNTWNYANGFFDGSLTALLNAETYEAMLRQRYGADFSFHALSYPPHILVLTWPLGLLPYGWALALWTFGGLVALAAALRLADLTPDQTALFWLAFAMPATIMCLIGGQIGLFAAALLLSGLLLRGERPVLAGILFGLLTIKPQLGLLLPVLLLVERRWSVIVAAGLTTLCLGGVSLLMVGVDGWQTYLQHVPPMQQDVLTRREGIMLAMMPTAYINARNVGLGDWASAAQAIATMATLGLFAVVLWRQRDPLWRNFALLIATASVSPYFFSYDLVALGAVALVLLAQDRQASPGRRLSLAMTLIVLAAILLPAITFITGLAGAPVSAPLMLLMLAAAAFYKGVNATAPG